MSVIVYVNPSGVSRSISGKLYLIMFSLSQKPMLTRIGLSSQWATGNLKAVCLCECAASSVRYRSVGLCCFTFSSNVFDHKDHMKSKILHFSEMLHQPYNDSIVSIQCHYLTYMQFLADESLCTYHICAKIIILLTIPICNYLGSLIQCPKQKCWYISYRNIVLTFDNYICFITISSLWYLKKA